MEMAPLLTIMERVFLPSLILLLFSLPLILKLTKKHLKLNLPPSPPTLPIIGHLHRIGKLPHRSFLALSNKYGPLMLLQVGQSPTLVVSSAELTRELMSNIDFMGRSGGMALDTLLYGRTDVAFAPYGDYWRQARKISVSHFMSLKKVESFQFVRDEEVTLLVNELRQLEGSSVNLSAMIGVAMNNIICRCLFSRRETGKGIMLSQLAREINVFLNSPGFGDLVPVLKWFDHFTGYNARLRATSTKLNAFFDPIIQERVDGDEKMDFLQILLQLQQDSTLGMDLTDDNIKALLTDMFLGGSDTTWTTIEWGMTELINNPKIMNKAQEEVRNVVGKKSRVDVNDINKMSYLKCVIKETLRMYPPLLLIPRETTQSTKLGGYDIPSKTKVFINAWAIQRDPKNWDRPEEFLPERFEDFPVEFNNPEFKLCPFGGGKRICPGVTFGMKSVEGLMANLLYWFDWKLPDGTPEKLDVNEAFGLVVTKKNPIHLVPILHFQILSRSRLYNIHTIRVGVPLVLP